MSFGKRKGGDLAEPGIRAQPSIRAQTVHESESEPVSTIGMIGFVARNLGPTSEAGLILGSIAAGGIILAVLVHAFFGLSSSCHLDERSLDPKLGLTANIETLQNFLHNELNCSQMVLVNKQGIKFLRTRSSNGTWTTKPYQPWTFDSVWRPTLEAAKHYTYPFVRAVW